MVNGEFWDFLFTIDHSPFTIKLNSEPTAQECDATKAQ